MVKAGLAMLWVLCLAQYFTCYELKTLHETLVLQLFYFYAPGQKTPVLNLHSLFFCLTPFGWMHRYSIHYPYENNFFIHVFFN